MGREILEWRWTGTRTRGGNLKQEQHRDTLELMNCAVLKNETANPALNCCSELLTQPTANSAVAPSVAVPPSYPLLLTLSVIPHSQLRNLLGNLPWSQDLKKTNLFNSYLSPVITRALIWYFVVMLLRQMCRYLMRYHTWNLICWWMAIICAVSLLQHRNSYTGKGQHSIVKRGSSGYE